MSLKTLTLSLSMCFIFSVYAQNEAEDNLATPIAIDLTSEVASEESEVLSVSEEYLKSVPKGRKRYFEVSAGYGIPFLPVNKRSPLMEIGDKDWYQRGQREISIKPLFGTNGGGWVANATLGQMFSEHIGIDATVSIAKHPEQLDARMDVVDPKTHYFASQRTSTTALYFAPHIVMKLKKGSFGVTSKVGLFLPFYGSTVSYAKIRDKSGRMIQTLTGLDLPGKGLVDINFNAKTVTSYKPTVGVSTSVSLNYMLTDRVMLFAQARVAAYTISLKETKFKELQMSTKILGIEIEELGPLRTKINNVNEAPEFLSKIVYKKEITEKSNTARYGGNPDMDKPMEEVGIKYNASSLYFNVGLSIDFDKFLERKAKKKEKKAAKK